MYWVIECLAEGINGNWSHTLVSYRKKPPITSPLPKQLSQLTPTLFFAYYHLFIVYEQNLSMK